MSRLEGCFSFSSSIDSPRIEEEETRRKSSLSQGNNCCNEQIPLQIYPLLKEMGTGWGNMEVPPLLDRNASGARSLIVDVGLDAGDEFFYAADKGFEVVGIDANPVRFPSLARRCRRRRRYCISIPNVNNIKLPLERIPGKSYIINAALGKQRGILPFRVHEPLGTFVNLTENASNDVVNVTVLPLDELIQEDVYLLKVDVQGFEEFVLQGASKLFQNHVVRQLIFEIDSKLLGTAGTNFFDILSMVIRDYGMTCFSTGNDIDYRGGVQTRFELHSDDANDLYREWFQDCWGPQCPTGMPWGVFDDLLCVNRRKTWRKKPMPMADSGWIEDSINYVPKEKKRVDRLINTLKGLNKATIQRGRKRKVQKST